jgi:hypothetical protein
MQHSALKSATWKMARKSWYMRPTSGMATRLRLSRRVGSCERNERRCRVERVLHYAHAHLSRSFLCVVGFIEELRDGQRHMSAARQMGGIAPYQPVRVGIRVRRRILLHLQLQNDRHAAEATQEMSRCAKSAAAGCALACR